MTSLGLNFRTKLIASIALAFAAVLGSFAITPAFAVGTLDQQATGASTRWYYIMNNVPLGQVFTAGISGQLDRFTIDGYSLSNPSAPLVANLYAVDGSGFPAGASLASASVSQTAIPSTVSTIVFDFGTPASITSGTQYVVLLTTSGTGEYHFENATTVPAGAKGIKPGAGNTGWQNYVDSSVTPNETSFRFATYVTPTSSSSPSATQDPTLVHTGIESSQALLLLGAGVFLLVAGGVITNTVRARVRRK